MLHNSSTEFSNGFKFAAFWCVRLGSGFGWNDVEPVDVPAAPASPVNKYILTCMHAYIYIQGVPGGM